MAAIRRAEASWSGALTTGSGEVSAVSSGAFSASARDVGIADRGVRRPHQPGGVGRGRPFRLLRDGPVRSPGPRRTPPKRLDVSAEVTFDKLEAGWRVVSSALTVRGRVPGIVRRRFRSRRAGDQGRLPDQRRPGRQRRTERRGHARKLIPGVELPRGSPGWCSARRSRAPQRAHPKVRERGAQATTRRSAAMASRP